MSEQVNAEAVEAQKRYGGSGGWDQATDEADALLRRAFIEGARWFAARQPARVVPSAEEVADLLLRVGHVEWDKTDARNVTEHILALFASQPTVAQVREQVAREIHATAERIEEGQQTANGFVTDTVSLILAGYAQAEAIARTETKGGE